MTDSDDKPSSTPSCNCKLGRIAAKYELSGLDDDLVAYWTGETEEDYSTRSLATVVNQRVLRAALQNANVSSRDGEIKNTYRLLTDDDVSSGERVEIRSDLQRDGVPISQVESDFVSHQTVYNHLTDCLGAKLDSPSDEELLTKSENKLGALQSRTEAVTADTIEQLNHKGIVDIGDFNVVISTTVICEDCYQQYTVQEFLEQGTCDCGDTNT